MTESGMLKHAAEFLQTEGGQAADLMVIHVKRRHACRCGYEEGVIPLSSRTAGSRMSQRGFTLFELIVVLFITGLVVSVAIVATGRMQDRAVFNEEARKIFQTLKHAREVSLFERRDVTFRIDEEEKRYWLDYGDEKESNARAVGKGFRLTGKDIFFFPKGNSSGGLVKIENEKGQGYAIKVDPVLGSPSIRRF
jgi:general secretion pathway protein H